MSVAHYAQFENGAGFGFAAQVWQWIKTGFARYQARRARIKAEAELRGLDNRTLADMGLSRCEISYRASHN